MNMMDRGRMATPPAPQPASLRRLRRASVVLLLLSALSVALIDAIRRVSIYAVAPVPFIMLGAIVTAVLYWVRRNRLEASYWTPIRQGAHIDAAVRSIHDERVARAAAKPIKPRRRTWWLTR